MVMVSTSFIIAYRYILRDTKYNGSNNLMFIGNSLSWIRYHKALLVILISKSMIVSQNTIIHYVLLDQEHQFRLGENCAGKGGHGSLQ